MRALQLDNIQNYALYEEPDFGESRCLEAGEKIMDVLASWTKVQEASGFLGFGKRVIHYRLVFKKRSGNDLSGLPLPPHAAACCRLLLPALPLRAAPTAPLSLSCLGHANDLVTWPALRLYHRNADAMEDVEKLSFTELHLVYSQARHDVIEGNFMCSELEALPLAALVMQVTPAAGAISWCN